MVENDLCINFRCLILYLARIIIAVTQIDKVINEDDIVSSDDIVDEAIILCVGSRNSMERYVIIARLATETGHANFTDCSRSKDKTGAISVSIY